MTESEKRVYDLLNESRGKGGITLKGISTTLNIKRVGSISDLLANLKKKGVIISRQRRGRNTQFVYWINERDYEDAPAYKREESREEYGKRLLDGVKRVSSVQTDHWLTDIKPFYFEKETIGVLFLADWHLGHPHADYSDAENICKLISQTEGLYVVLVGDMIDNSVNAYSPKGTVNIVDKDGQLAMLEYLLDIIKSRLLVMYEGNHEIRSVISDHFRITEFLADKYCASYGQYGAGFSLFMNEKEIKIYCRHKMKGSSQYNPLHQNLRSILFDSAERAGDADVIVRGHTHERAMGIWKVGHKYRYMAVCGNIMVYDEFADRINYEPGKSSMPVLIIRRDGELRLCPTLKQGVEDLKAFRVHEHLIDEANGLRELIEKPEKKG